MYIPRSVYIELTNENKTKSLNVLSLQKQIETLLKVISELRANNERLKVERDLLESENTMMRSLLQHGKTFPGETHAHAADETDGGPDVDQNNLQNNLQAEEALQINFLQAECTMLRGILIEHLANLKLAAAPNAASTKI